MKKFNNFIKENNIESSDINMFDDKFKKVRNFLVNNLITEDILDFKKDDIFELSKKLKKDKFKEYYDDINKQINLKLSELDLLKLIEISNDSRFKNFSNIIDKKIKFKLSNSDDDKLKFLLNNKKIEKYRDYINNLINKNNDNINTNTDKKVELRIIK